MTLQLIVAKLMYGDIYSFDSSYWVSSKITHACHAPFNYQKLRKNKLGLLVKSNHSLHSFSQLRKIK